MEYDDRYFMQEALKQARQACEENEVPIGCVVVCNNKVISRSYNMTEQLKDVTAHAEILAITSAEQTLQSKYLRDCTLYVTIEPCLMCAGAIFWSQISKLVYGAKDPKRGASLLASQPYHNKTQVIGGVLEEECSALVKDFFKSKR
ncbi:MAG: nucleoside deaminase [Bacteroidota bacterium]|nr:nucleoside deaminase [Bacteroidota bacterium]